MKFQISTQELKKALDAVSYATASITTTPILENILITAEKDKVSFVSNNLEMAIEYTVNQWISTHTTWSFSVPSKIFSNYIWLLEDDTLNLELFSDDSLQLKSDSWSIKIKGIEASEFPLVPPIQEEVSFHITWNILKKSIEKTLFSAAEWNIRPTLAGLYFRVIGKEIMFASTDSLRLSEYKIIHEKDMNVDFSQIIPSKTCSAISRMFADSADIKIVSGDNQIAFYTENTRVYSRLLNGSFPDYSWFFPDTHNSKAVVNTNDLIATLRKINLISRENNFSIKVSFSAETGLVFDTSETQIGEWVLPLVASIEGDDNIIWINSTFLLDVLNVIESSHVSISFESPLSQILIVPVSEDGKKLRGSYRHIIMPLKI